MRARATKKPQRSRSEDIEQRAREMANQMMIEEPIVVDEEPDLQSMFARLLWQEDWTDKVSNGIGRLFHRSVPVEEEELESIVEDEEMPEELEALIPDMNEAKRAYNEMTSDYLDFIRMVWNAQELRKQQTRSSFTHNRR